MSEGATKSKVNIDQLDHDGNSPFMVAIIAKNWYIAKLFISCNKENFTRVNVNIMNKEGNTAFDLALKEESTPDDLLITIIKYKDDSNVNAYFMKLIDAKKSPEVINVFIEKFKVGDLFFLALSQYEYKLDVAKAIIRYTQAESTHDGKYWYECITDDNIRQQCVDFYTTKWTPQNHGTMGCNDLFKMVLLTARRVIDVPHADTIEHLLSQVTLAQLL